LPDAALAAPTIAAALNRASAQLAAAGCETPRLDAEVLLGFALGVGRERLLLDAGRRLEVDAAERFDQLVSRRAAREPVAYITGVKAFRRIGVKVDRRVLIPRPETELLVEVGLSLPRGARVADVGTGSGAVALALQDERPDLEVWATDVSPGAVAAARENGVARVVLADLLDGVPGQLDAVLANLPYVGDGALLPPDIELYEPAGALFGGADGLDVVRRLIAVAAGRGVPLLALEIGFDQAEAVARLVHEAGFGSVSRLRDLAGWERVIIGRRS
jgi:release factor glutamine methyltransferase